jgi:hypothetical protein
MTAARSRCVLSGANLGCQRHRDSAWHLIARYRMIQPNDSEPAVMIQ